MDVYNTLMTSRSISRLGITTLCFIAITLYVAVPMTAFAFVPLSDGTSEASMFQSFYGSDDLGGFVNRLFQAALSIGAILAVLRLAYAGYVYMTSEAFGHKSHAKEIIGDAILGLLLLLSIWLILYQINPEILNLNILTKIQTVTLPK